MQRSEEASGPVSRRRVIQGSIAALAVPMIFGSASARAAGRFIKLGLVAPRTGPLAAFTMADPFVLDQIQAAIGPGIHIGGELYAVQIIAKDSQSSSSRASDVAADLILGDKVDIILAASTPDTVNPVSDQAEANEVPCITTDCPWQSYFFGRKGDPNTGFQWTYHFFWGLDEIAAAYLALWSELDTNKLIGGLFPNDADGNAWGDPKAGLPVMFAKAGYKLVDPGRFQPFSNDFTAHISAFKDAGVEILAGVLAPPDFATFWAQAAQQGFHPKIATLGKAVLFPSALGQRGNGVSTEVWWTPHHPYKSGLTGQSAADLCDAYTKATGRIWIQPMGYKYALLEVAIDVLKRCKDLMPETIMAAIRATDYQSIAGQVKWTGQPMKNVAKTPLVAGQWHLKDGQFDLVIAENVTAPEIPFGSKLEALS